MTYLYANSEKNRDSAEILLDERHYCSVPHVAYYSCIQLMLHILKQFGDDDAKIEQRRKEMALTEGRDKMMGTHECIIKLIKAHSKAIYGDYGKVRPFNTNIDTLKSFRVTADYKDEEITAAIGQSSLALCDDINTFLKDCFQKSI